jgi:beta-lactam-binding protein with PASTA domain
LILRFFQFVLVALSLCIIALLSAITTMHFAIHGAEVKVPDFRGMDVSAAMRKAAQMNLSLSVDEHFYSATTTAGHVLTQSPAPGSSVRSEWSVRVTDSLGPQRVAIPKVTGIAERVATLNIRKLGLDLGTIARMPYGAQPPGMVIAQTPQPGAANVDRPNVSLLLATPAQTMLPASVMPDLTDSNYAEAAAAITRAGLKLGPAQYRNVGIPAVAAVDTDGIPQPPKPPLPAGIVLAQSPDAGMHIDANTTIELTVSQ